jgi:DNA-binding NarL/FixJ family response regulator
MKRILVIEDHPLMRRNIVLILQREQFEVEGAENGRIGLKLARLNPPDLVLCDIMMPELDGYAVLNALRADAATALVPFIFLTAKGERAQHRAGMDLGADDYLTKPVTREELLGAVHARLKRTQAQQQSPAFQPDFSDASRLESLGISPREAEVLCWLAQGKSNGEIAGILGMTEHTVKKHLQHIFEKLGVESRHAAAVRALETLPRR